ncbi:MAG TPA: HAD-IIA family hydrolase [Acidimicrobiales bacterium]|nr:HAD-IIA family hydrolase [Acidimicrobiales bacterium]
MVQATLKGLLIDIDGVLTVSWKPLPGASDCFQWLRQSALPFRLVTNTSSKSRRQIADTLSEAGLQVDPSEISTAVSSAARHLAERYAGEACLVVNEGPLDEDLSDVTQTSDPRSARVVLLGGAGPSTGYCEFDTVFKLAHEGVPVLALHRNTRFQTADGPAMDMGAFILGLEAAAHVDIPVLGKPSGDFFEAALKQMDLTAGEVAMVGDDVYADVLGAQKAGITGVLVKTGKFDQRELDKISPSPDHVIEEIGRLPELLRTFIRK